MKIITYYYPDYLAVTREWRKWLLGIRLRISRGKTFFKFLDVYFLVLKKIRANLDRNKRYYSDMFDTLRRMDLSGFPALQEVKLESVSYWPWREWGSLFLKLLNNALTLEILQSWTEGLVPSYRLIGGEIQDKGVQR